MEKTSYTMVTHSTAHILKTILNQSHPLVSGPHSLCLTQAIVHKVRNQEYGRIRLVNYLSLLRQKQVERKAATEALIALLGKPEW